ncbi:MAM and LDL-receptor class A domain-containing protein 2-like isoform X2 [Mizuhopecten yessoensis]|uniref:MAM and LDL-receptor class A domain-containing protein 2-like isoform X2 n=1 Tax=Mizuhopecten yessoensis TaxID=6573 RepID=UPI000B45E716|nr:MAM and LDL-receptor class A domain-containing protein 2-like isoform X2 [Mizuhopecten yessoensis]
MYPSNVTEDKCPPFQLKGSMRVKYSRRYARFYCDPPFTMYGSKRANCVGGVWTGGQPLCIVSRCPDLTMSDPHLTVYRRYQGALLLFSCPPGMSVLGDNQLVCDGEKWSGVVPTCVFEEAERSCGFEDKDLCGWTSDVNCTLAWTWTNGSTPTNRTGPSTGHSPAGTSGYYLYMESSGPSSGRNNEARLLSPWFRDVPEGTCFQFFYHMLGQESHGDYSSLFVYVRDEQSVENLVFSTSGSHGNRWVRGLVILTEDHALFQIVIQATRSSNWAHDVAIDDVTLYNCSNEDIELSPDVTSVTDREDNSTTSNSFTDKYEMETTTMDHVTNKISNFTTLGKTITQNPELDSTTKSPTAGTTIYPLPKQSDYKIQNGSNPDNYTHLYSENASTADSVKTKGTFVVPSSRVPMSDNELYTLYTGLIVVVIIILLLLLTILVGVQVQWRKKRTPRADAMDEAIEMEMMNGYKSNGDASENLRSVRNNSADSFITDTPRTNEDAVFCTHL